MSKGSEKVKLWRKKTKERLARGFDNKCGLCGYSSITVMDFHHVNPEEKEFGLGAVRGSIKSWDKIVNEVRKCVMLCANCHREVHAGEKILPENIMRFNEEYADYRKFEYKSYQTNQCPVCKKDKPLKKNTCSVKCSTVKRGKIDWDKYDPLLKKEIENKTPILQIAKMIGNISDNGVRKRAKKLGLI